MTAAKKKSTAVSTEVITAYKGFNKDMKCRNFQFEIGKTYTHDREVKACNSGFHACEYPLDVFGYYAPSGSVFAIVEQSGQTSREENTDSKVASSVIQIKAAIDIPNLVKAAIEFTSKRCDPVKAQHSKGTQAASSATGTQAASSATGDQAASSATGDQAASSATGTQAASSATGYQAASSATGYQAASSATGTQAASSATGDQAASSATGDQAASSATGTQAASSATGYQAASSATGTQAASSATGTRAASSATGYQAASTTTAPYSTSQVLDGSKESVAVGLGYENKARASEGNWIVLAERDSDYKILGIKSAQAGVTKGVKAHVWYMLKSGKFVEVK